MTSDKPKLVTSLLIGAVVFAGAYYLGRASTADRPLGNRGAVSLGQPCTYDQLRNPALNTHEFLCFFYSSKPGGGYPPTGVGEWIQSAPLVSIPSTAAPTPQDFAALRDLKHYESAKGHFSFDYPAGWVLINRSDGSATEGVTIAPNASSDAGLSIEWVPVVNDAAVTAEEQRLFEPSFVRDYIVRQEGGESSSTVDTFTIVRRFTFPDVEQERTSVWFLRSQDHFVRIDAVLGTYPTIDAGTYEILTTLRTQP